MTPQSLIETTILDSRLGSLFPLPSYKTDGAAGMDLLACLPTAHTLDPSDTLLVNSGIAVSIRNAGIMGLIAPRSGLGVKHGIVLANTVGIIDSDYQGELLIPLRNSGKASYTLEPGERICQLIFVGIIQTNLKIVESFSTNTERGKDGFGSTGRC